jgi:hypothetical protein
MFGPLPLLLAPLTVLNFEDRSEVRVRPNQGEAAAIDLVNAAKVGVTVATRESSFGATYSPMFTYYQVGQENSIPGLFHGASLNFSQAFSRVFFGLTETLSAGQTNFRIGATAPITPTAPNGSETPAPPAVPPTSGLPPAQSGAKDAFLWYGSSRTILTVGEILSKRSTLFQSAFYGIESGLDDTARANYPLQTSLGGSFGSTYQLAKRDSLGTTLAGSFVRTNQPIGANLPNRDALILSVSESWAREMARGLSGQMLLGLSWTQDQSGDAPPARTIYPTASVSLTGELPLRSTLQGALGLGPLVDRFTGAIDYRGTWSVVYTQTRTRLIWSVGTAGASSLNLDSPNSIATAGVSGTIAYALADEWFVDARTGTSWQLLGANENTPFLWTLAAGLTFRPQPERL